MLHINFYGYKIICSICEYTEEKELGNESSEKQVIALLKKNGWKFRKPKYKWLEYCPKCVKEKKLPLPPVRIASITMTHSDSNIRRAISFAKYLIEKKGLDIGTGISIAANKNNCDYKQVSFFIKEGKAGGDNRPLV